MQQTLQADDTLELSLANDLREMSVVAAEIDEFCTAQQLATEIAYAANLAIEELLTNSTSHGYDDDEPHRIEIILRREPDDLVIVIVDASAPFDPSRVPGPDVAAPLADRDPGGAGAPSRPSGHGWNRVPASAGLQHCNLDEEHHAPGLKPPGGAWGNAGHRAVLSLLATIRDSCSNYLQMTGPECSRSLRTCRIVCDALAIIGSCSHWLRVLTAPDHLPLLDRHGPGRRPLLNAGASSRPRAWYRGQPIRRLRSLWPSDSPMSILRLPRSGSGP